MKKILCLVFVILCANFSVNAAAGDTTWVQANNTQLTYYNHYDTTVTFPAPGTSYRKIYMIFTLGKYMCAGYNPANPGPAPGTGWCGDWDYTIQNYLMTPAGDTLEIGRLISPYANTLAPRTPWTWTQQYVYDVTDYASVLQNSATMRLFYSGYSGGFTANIKFMFIEGTPDRNVKGIHALWNGSFTYGDTVGGDANDINTHFTAVSEVAPAGTQSADLKFTVTGHGSDTINECCEFASHNYQVMLNGASVNTTTIWRGDCGLNELYPQSGTWLLQRANWCPGALVYSFYHVLPGITAGSNFNVGIKFDTYQERPSSDGYGLYTTFGTMIYYGGINKTLDASIEEIIAPNSNPIYFRENPVLGTPTLHVRNSGSTTINSIQFQYGIQGGELMDYVWVGTLTPLQDTVINLADLLSLSALSGTSGTYNFIVEIENVNGITDADQTNDTMRSQFISAPNWPSTFTVEMRTNNEATSTNPSICETSWAIYDKNNTIVASRANGALNTTYNDTISLPIGYYQLQIYDSSCDGLDWFEFPYYGITAGYLKIIKAPYVLVPMNGYNYSGSYNNDFGCGFSQYFYVGTPEYAGVKNVIAGPLTLNAYPNPATGIVNVDIEGMQQVSGTIQLMDELGRLVLKTPVTAAHQQINIAGLADGVYSVLYLDAAGQNRLQARLVIAK